MRQTWAYDWLGNTTNTDDDAKGFYDRSLGGIVNGTASAGPYQLKSAGQTAGPRAGSLTTKFDDAGYLTSLAVQRSGPCLPTGAKCHQRFVYEWDEVGRLSRARRWDLTSAGVASDPVPSGTPAAELRYQYDGGDQRTLKTSVDSTGAERHTLYVLGSVEVRRAEFVSGEYTLGPYTVVPYLFAHGVRLARLAWEDSDAPSIPTLTNPRLHVFFELGDHLGSSSTVLDKDTSELVEKSTYQPGGGAESDYRPGRWKGFREDHRFTAKEGDEEVGLTYFGFRYLSTGLGRWISADPLAVHQRGSDPNVFAYVSGRALRAVDPVGLCPIDECVAPPSMMDGPLAGVSNVVGNFAIGFAGAVVDMATPRPVSAGPPSPKDIVKAPIEAAGSWGTRSPRRRSASRKGTRAESRRALKASAVLPLSSHPWSSVASELSQGSPRGHRQSLQFQAAVPKPEPLAPGKAVPAAPVKPPAPPPPVVKAAPPAPRRRLRLQSSSDQRPTRRRDSLPTSC